MGEENPSKLIADLEKRIRDMTSSARDTELEILFYKINEELKSPSSKGNGFSIYNAQLIGLKSVYELKCQLWGTYEPGPDGFVEIVNTEPPIHIEIDDEDRDEEPDLLPNSPYT